MITLTIYGRLEGLNDYIKACRTNKFLGAKLKRDIESVITGYIQEQIPNVHFTEPVRLSFRWYEPNRKRDLDNISASKKFLLDALVSNGVIKTDSWQGVVGFTDKFFVDKDNPRIEVDIEVVNDETDSM